MRIYGAFPVVRLPKKQYEQSQFLRDCSLLKYDEVQERDSDIIFLQYLMVESENYATVAGCRNHRPSYSSEYLDRELHSSNQLSLSTSRNRMLCGLVDFTFHDYKYKLNGYPQNHPDPTPLADIRKIAASEGLSPADY